MFDLPASTEFNKRIPKQKFYENLSITPALKKAFVEQIKVIWWRNKLAATTLNLAAGEQVTEIEVFELRLATGELDEEVLRQIDKEIPYHILFLLEYEGKYQAWIGYKEAAAGGGNAFKVNRYYHTAWMPPQELPLRLAGLTLDAVYEGFVRQIAGGLLQDAPTETLKESVEKAQRKAALEKQLANLEKKAWAERQPRKKFELADRIRALKAELQELDHTGE
jgi:hypothetical protein